MYRPDALSALGPISGDLDVVDMMEQNARNFFRVEVEDGDLLTEEN